MKLVGLSQTFSADHGVPQRRIPTAIKTRYTQHSTCIAAKTSASQLTGFVHQRKECFCRISFHSFRQFHDIVVKQITERVEKVRVWNNLSSKRM